MLFNFLLHEPSGHEQCSTELIRFEFFMIDSAGRISVSAERQMAIDEEL
jgi:hypothetical protein